MSTQENKTTQASALHVVVASLNPVKISAAKEAFQAVFQKEVNISAVDVDSGVPDQPMDYEQTHQGAKNRVNEALALQDADYYIAFEGGVDVFEDGPKTFGVICISDRETTVFGQSATLPLPMQVYAQLLAGVELGSAMDALFNTVNIKQKGGAIGQLADGLETRMSVYRSATILALSRFKHAALFD